jgi:hypothetical protein
MELYSSIHEYSENHHLIKISITKLLELPVKNWKYNRPPDEVRVAEIENYLKRKDSKILQPFYIHYNTICGTYEILDGIHRYSAIKHLQPINDKILFVHLFIDLTDGTLIDIFKDLNKTVPVPELYISTTTIDDSANEKAVIEDIVKEWQRKYKQHFSSSNNYTIPNINRDSFINMLSELYTTYRVRSKPKMLEILERANNNIRDYLLSGITCKTISTKFSEKQKEKCKDSGCYLFLYKDIETIKYFINKERIVSV